MSIIYLAGPYSNGSASTRLARFHAMTHVAAKLVEQQKIVFSPLTMTHPIDLVLAEDGETLGSDYWVKFDEAFMSFCSEIYVVKLPQWELSSGVKREVDFFEKQGIKPVHLQPEDYGVEATIEHFRAAFEI